MILLRSVIYVIYLYATMAVIAIVFAPLAILAPLRALIAPRIWARTSIWGLRVICGARIRVEGAENVPPGVCLVASKHQAMLDTLTPFLVLKKPAIVIKEELLRMPLFGWFCLRVGMIPIDREGGATTLKRMVRGARKAAEDGREIVIFPEGTRQEVGAAPDYKPGVAALYRELRAPCVPVAVSTGLVWSAHGPIRRPGLAVIRFLPAIPPDLPRAEFMRELETRIETATNALIAEARQ